MYKGKYNPSAIEKKWQVKWASANLFSPEIESAKNPFYNLYMFPYPSAEGLHAGHAFSSTGSDIYGRFKRMNGKTVFQPIGYDSFGIHSENYAIKIGQKPADMLARTTKHYEEQLKSLGHGYDWTRTVTTSDPNYYKWTQWLFIEMFKAGLAYKKKAAVNFCPSCKTVLADEQVMTPAQAGKEAKDARGHVVDNNGDVRVCERCGTVVEKRELEQWFFKITDYADRLLDGLEKIDWSPRVKIAQKEWIGKKEGIEITYPIKGKKETVRCFTTRPDTNFGATFVVVAPEYARENLQMLIPSKYKKSVSKYIEESLKKTEQQRREEGRKKTGQFTGLYAINQLNGYEMPIYVSDFVLMDFGTGAVVGVPGHDKRDFEFASTFSLPVIRVVVGSDADRSEITSIQQVQEGEGIMVNSEFLNGLDIHKATKKMMDHLEEKGWGKRVTTYHLRDWLVSRQRYWGTPIPMIYCESCAKNGHSWFSDHEATTFKGVEGWYPVETKNLPVLLPDISDYKPKGEGKGPLADHPEFYETKCPKCGQSAKRETDVMDTFVDSSWYFLRYPSTRSATSGQVPFDPEITKKWLPVDLYFGGAEHAVLHLMYARFVNMVLHDRGYINFEEPFPRFFAHGLLIKDGAKMSKSRGNVVNPDEYIKKFGADTLRLYLMFIGPMDSSPDFRDAGIEGMGRFLERVWRLFAKHNKIVLSQSDSKEVMVKMHQTIKKVTEDIEEFGYNTAISAIMEYVNVLRTKIQKSKSKIQKYKSEDKIRCAEWDEALRTLALLLAPFAPHLGEEVWVNILGQKFSVHTSSWPTYDPKFVQEEKVTIVVQVNGKVREQLEVTHSDAEDKKSIEIQAKKSKKAAKWLKDRSVKKAIFVPGRLINFVTE